MGVPPDKSLQRTSQHASRTALPLNSSRYADVVRGTLAAQSGSEEILKPCDFLLVVPEEFGHAGKDIKYQVLLFSEGAGLFRIEPLELAPDLLKAPGKLHGSDPAGFSGDLDPELFLVGSEISPNFLGRRLLDGLFPARQRQGFFDESRPFFLRDGKEEQGFVHPQRRRLLF